MKRQAFTLVELLIVVSIISIIAGMSMAALMGAAEEGRRTRAKAQVSKIDQLISEKWNGYRFRQLPIRIPSGTRPMYSTRMRLDVMRELQRLEMPDRLSDVMDNPVSPVPAVQDPNVPTTPPQPVPAVMRSYRRKIPANVVAAYNAGQNNTYDQAEMLYLILSEMRDGDRSALSFFMSSEIGDADQDGLNEILDPWGTPIMFLRWAPGYSRATISEDVKPGDPLSNYLQAPAPLPTVGVSTFQIPAGQVAPDSFDPLKCDPRWDPNSLQGKSGFKPFLLRPLIFSAGPDKVHDIYMEDYSTIFRYSQTATTTGVVNDPYCPLTASGNNVWIGSPADYSNDGLQNGDNITNHGLELAGE